MDYKNTLNLPKTAFPMKANLAGLEPRMIDFWQEQAIYLKMLQSRQAKEKFILHDGPPYANGLIHIGHALNKILKDIVIKYKNLRGFQVPYVAGWDCHGLPVEHQLFKELKLTKHDVEVSDFRQKAKEYALKFVEIQKEDFKRLGLFSDWTRPYLTLEPGYECNVMNLLEELTAQGYVYRGRKPVNWCSLCETALAEAEVEYNDKRSDSIYFLFPIIEAKGDLAEYKDKTVSLVVWTTTPWTLVANVAVALNPNLEYVVAGYDQSIGIFAKNRLADLSEKFNKEFTVIKTLKGSELEGLVLKHPFLERQVQSVLADFVSGEDGSGCVHIAPGHGSEDFSLTKKYDLEVIMPVNEKGLFTQPQDFAGKNIHAANEYVIEQLNARQALLLHESLQHSYPHCWRCGSPIIFRATYQWFVEIDHQGLRDKALKEIENVRWVPLSGKERMRSMVSGRPDWCISRQRLWGIPIPALKCKKCSHVFLNREILKRVAEIFAQQGSNAWFSLAVGEFLPSGFSCPQCAAADFDKEFDILDVWFESGASFRSVVKADKRLCFPADLYLEGSDQHRGWFQVSLLPSVAVEKRAPFKTILTHGFVVDASGKKMSKSQGNVIAPQKIISRYGAEILRLWAACSDYSEDVKISDDILTQLVDMYRKVRNTMRFILANVADFDLKNTAIVYQDLSEVDKYMLARLAQISKEILECYDDYAFYKVCQKIFNFCNMDLSSFYLDILKDRLYTFSQKSKQRQSAQYVLCIILQRLINLLAPVLSFTAEEAYQCFDNMSDKKESVFLETLEIDQDSAWQNSSILSQWDCLLMMRQKALKEIETQRTSGVIGSSLEASVTITCEGKEYTTCCERARVLKEILIVSNVEIKQGSFSVKVSKAEGRKCPRCWHWTAAEVAGLDDVCAKCVQSLKEAQG